LQSLCHQFAYTLGEYQLGFYIDPSLYQPAGNYGEKEKGQTLIFEDLSNWAPQNSEMLNLWRDFQKVVTFIDENQEWLRTLIEQVKQ